MKFGPGVRINWAKLAIEMEAKRQAANLSILDASIECGMTSMGSWSRIIYGKRCHAETFVRVLHWLGTTDAKPFLLWDSKGDKGW